MNQNIIIRSAKDLNEEQRKKLNFDILNLLRNNPFIVNNNHEQHKNSKLIKKILQDFADNYTDPLISVYVVKSLINSIKTSAKSAKKKFDSYHSNKEGKSKKASTAYLKYQFMFDGQHITKEDVFTVNNLFNLSGKEVTLIHNNDNRINDDDNDNQIYDDNDNQINDNNQFNDEYKSIRPNDKLIRPDHTFNNLNDSFYDSNSNNLYAGNFMDDGNINSFSTTPSTTPSTTQSTHKRNNEKSNRDIINENIRIIKTLIEQDKANNPVELYTRSLNILLKEFYDKNDLIEFEKLKLEINKLILDKMILSIK